MADSSSKTRKAKNVSTEHGPNPHHMWNSVPGLDQRFAELVLREINIYGRCGSGVKPACWKNIISDINKEFNLNVTPKHLKNHTDEMKKKYSAWKYLISKTGSGYNESTGLFSWSDDAWEAAIQVHPKAKEFKTKPLSNVDLWAAIFEPGHASGSMAWGPGHMGIPPVEQAPDHPTHFDAVMNDVSLEEDSRADEYFTNYSFTHVSDDDNNDNPENPIPETPIPAIGWVIFDVLVLWAVKRSLTEHMPNSEMSLNVPMGC